MAETDTAALTMDNEGDGWLSTLSDGEMIALFAGIIVVFALTLFSGISIFLFGLFPGQNRCENPGCRKRCSNTRWMWDDNELEGPRKVIQKHKSMGYAITKIYHHDVGKCDYRSSWQMIKSKKGSVMGESPFSLLDKGFEVVAKT